MQNLFSNRLFAAFEKAFIFILVERHQKSFIYGSSLFVHYVWFVFEIFYLQ